MIKSPFKIQAAKVGNFVHNGIIFSKKEAINMIN